MNAPVCSWCQGAGQIEDTEGCIWPCFCVVSVDSYRVEEVEVVGVGQVGTEGPGSQSPHILTSGLLCQILGKWGI